MDTTLSLALIIILLKFAKLTSEKFLTHVSLISSILKYVNGHYIYFPINRKFIFYSPLVLWLNEAIFLNTKVYYHWLENVCVCRNCTGLKSGNSCNTHVFLYVLIQGADKYFSKSIPRCIKTYSQVVPVVKNLPTMQEM